MKNLFIDGKWVDSVSDQSFNSYNPATGEVLEEFQSGFTEDIDAAVQAAKKAKKNWHDVGVANRAEYLRKYLNRLIQNREKLAHTVTKEVGKTLDESKAEIDDAINLTDYLVGEGKRYFGYVAPSTQKNRLCYTMRTPYGVAALICPWNFPVSINIWKVSPALLCGNTAIIKPSSNSPLTSYELVKIGEDIFPPGVLNLVCGFGRDIGRHIVSHPDVDVVSFTGSTHIGKEITQASGLKEIGLELGGKNPAVVMPTADIEKAVDDTVKGAFGVAGQRCTATSRVIVHQDIFERFKEMLLKKTKKLKVGNGLEPETDVGPMITARQMEKVEEYVKGAVAEGAEVLCGGERLDGPGNFYLPTILNKVRPDMRIAQEEVFGPVLCLFTCSSFQQGLSIANDVPYGLSSAIYTKNISEAFDAANKLESGIVVVNNPPGAVEAHLPFGGIKDSGIGREGGIEGIDEFSRTKTVYIDY